MLIACTLDMMRKEWYFPSGVFLVETHNPKSSREKHQTNPTWNKIPAQYSSNQSKALEMRRTWETVTDQRRPRRHDNWIKCVILDGILCYTNEPKTASVDWPLGCLPFHSRLWSLPVQSSKVYTSNCFKYSPNEQIFSHLEPACFVYPAKLLPTSASHR